ncbi:MAG: hypothetical protein WD669_02195 [Pirellulales bacterium]
MTNRPHSILLPNQKQTIVEVLVQAGLEPNEFDWSDIPSEYRSEDEKALLIQHHVKDYSCKIDRTRWGNWVITHCPGNATEWLKKTETSWEHAPQYLKAWADRVAAELSADNYVQIALKSPQLLRLPEPGKELEPIPPDQREILIQRLDAIELHVLSLRSGSAEFETQVRTSFQFLKNHAKQSDRRSLYALVFSTLLAIGLEFLNATETKEVIQYATTQINIEIKDSANQITYTRVQKNSVSSIAR